MTPESGRIEAETIAALLDGRLSKSERDSVLRALNESPEDMRVFLAAAAIEAEMRREGDDDRLMVKQSVRWRRSVVRATSVLALAAALVLIVWPDRSASRIPEALSASGVQTLDISTGERGWGFSGWVVRGSGAANAPSMDAFRAGVYSIDWHVALVIGDGRAASHAVDAIRSLAQAMPGGGAVLTQLHSTVGDTMPSVDLDHVLKDLRDLLGDSQWFDVGAAAEVLRIGAVRQSIPSSSVDSLVYRFRARLASARVKTPPDSPASRFADELEKATATPTALLSDRQLLAASLSRAMSAAPPS